MLQFDVALCLIARNVAHKVRRYSHLFVASELVSDVAGGIPNVKGSSPRMILNQIRHRRISAFLTLSSLKGIKRRIFMK